jgi:hypothetical protein
VNPVDDAEAAIAARVARDAPTWFPGTPHDQAVHLRTLASGRRSRVYVVSVGEPTAPPLLVAKVRRQGSATGAGRQGPSRPTLTPSQADEAELTEREYAGLGVIAETFAAGDPRFGAIRPLALLAEHHTILMELASGDPVRQLVLRASRIHPARLRSRGSSPEPVLPGVGAWLRRFHDAQSTASYPVRQGTGHDVVTHFCALEEFLGRRLGRGFGDLAGAGSGLAAELLPSGPLPLAVGHGDFAPRNVLVDGAGRLVVIDPQPRWALPAQEDLCRFLVGLQLLGLQTYTRGAAFSAATLAHWQELVIAGYHGAGAPLPALRCYQLLILLDKWSALLDQAPVGGLRGRGRRLLQEAATGYVRAQAEQLVDLARRESA